MEVRLAEYRRYVQDHACPCDIVIFVDSADVMILGSPTEVEKRFRLLEGKWNRSLFFAAETVCQDWDVTDKHPVYTSPLCDELDAASHGRGPWRYPNAGSMAGRGRVFQRVFRDEPIPQALKHDQPWWRRSVYLKHLGVVSPDFNNDLFQIVTGIEHAFSFNGPDGPQSTGKWRAALRT